MNIQEELKVAKEASELFWQEYHKKSKLLLLGIAEAVFDVYQLMFEKYPDIKHINQNLNFYDVDETVVSFSINAYLENEDTLDDDDFFYLDDIKKLLESIYHLRNDMYPEIIITRDTTLEMFCDDMDI